LSPTDLHHLSATVGVPTTISLESTPGSGAIWYGPAQFPGADLRELPSVAIDPGVGGRARQQFLFVPKQPGVFVVTFQLRRAWEDAVRREASFRITVHREST
jgi:hypothetical protein